MALLQLSQNDSLEVFYVKWKIHFKDMNVSLANSVYFSLKSAFIYIVIFFLCSYLYKNCLISVLNIKTCIAKDMSPQVMVKENVLMKVIFIHSKSFEGLIPLILHWLLFSNVEWYFRSVTISDTFFFNTLQCTTWYLKGRSYLTIKVHVYRCLNILYWSIVYIEM